MVFWPSYLHNWNSYNGKSFILKHLPDAHKYTCNNGNCRIADTKYSDVPYSQTCLIIYAMTKKVLGALLFVAIDKV